MLHEKSSNKGPHFRPLSYHFFNTIKSGDDVETRNCLKLDPLLVMDFDNIGMTGLHWAVKKGLNSMVDLLVTNHANPAAEDMLKRTPEQMASESPNKYIQAIFAKINAEKTRSKRMADVVGEVIAQNLENRLSPNAPAPQSRNNLAASVTNNKL